MKRREIKRHPGRSPGEKDEVVMIGSDTDCAPHGKRPLHK